jgi:hypothetical protein
MMSINNLTNPQKSDMAQQIAKYHQAIDIDYAYSIAEKLSVIGGGKYGFREAGSIAENKAADWLFQEMDSLGLQDISKEGFPVDKWEFHGGELQVLEPLHGNSMEIWPFPSATITGPITGELIFLNRAKREDYTGKNVRGKIILADTDQDDCMVMPITLQAELEGALAIIFVHMKNYAQFNDDTLFTWGFEAPQSIPSFSIGRADAKVLKELINAETARVTINAKSTIEPNGTSYNIVGKLLGNSSKEQIIIGGHYDAHSFGFQDDASAVGLTLGIAKGLIDSGYQPEHSIVFILHGAEEFGAVNTKYDWCIGSWNQVFKLHPEWAGKSLAFFNFEIAAYEHQPHASIVATQELFTYLNEFCDSIHLPEGEYPEEIKVSYPTFCWSDDFSYTIAGIPSTVTSELDNTKEDSGKFSVSDYNKTIFHTQYDTKETYNENVFKHNLEFYGQLAINLDNKVVLPLDFSVHANQMAETIDQDLYALAHVGVTQLIDEISILGRLGKQKYEEFTTLNHLYDELNKAEREGKEVDSAIIEAIRRNAQNANSIMLKAYKIAQDKLVRLSWDDKSIFAHEHAQNNIKLLDEAINVLSDGNARYVLDNVLWKIEEKKSSYTFDKEIVQKNVDMVFAQPAERLFWGAGRIVGYIDLYDTIASLQKKVAINTGNFNNELATLKDILEAQKKLLEQVSREELKVVEEVHAQLAQVELSDIIRKAKKYVAEI